MFDRIAEFLGESSNTRKIRYMGFSMATVGMVVGVVAAVVATVTGITGLGICAAVLLVGSFLLFPTTDINFPSRGYY